MSTNQADLTLRITLRSDQRTLDYELTNNPRLDFGYYLTGVGSIGLNDTPRAFLDALFSDLNVLARHSTYDYTLLEQAEVSRHLATIGQTLYRDLLPNDLKAVYRVIRKSLPDRPLSLLIVSSEPWIPWELVKPYEGARAGGERIDDPFWCESFFLTRWLSGPAPRSNLTANTLAVVAPSSDLSNVQQELAYLRGLAQRSPAPLVLAPLGRVSDVIARLSNGQAQVWHFACHGNFNSDVPDRSVVQLDDGELKSEDMVGPVEDGIYASKPLVLLNACHTARRGFALTGIGGWAARLVNAGASAFIGSQWEANDQLAAQFAIAFYEALWNGQALGEAAHTARMTIKTAGPTNPTWLAYAVYGEPGLRVSLAAPDSGSLTAPAPAPQPQRTTATSADQAAVDQTRSSPAVAPPSPRLPSPPVISAPVDTFQYDAFVSYAHAEPDESWVKNVLLPSLKDEGLKINTDEDFALGSDPIDQMANAIQNSRRTVAVFSERYLASGYGVLQSTMSQTLGVEESGYRLLPLIYQKSANLPLRYRMLWSGPGGVDYNDPATRGPALVKIAQNIRILPRR